MKKTSGDSLKTRIVDYLRWAAEQEENSPFWDEYCIAWMTVAGAAQGNPQPHIAASYAHLGVHPDKVWQEFRRRRRDRLGPLFNLWYDAAGNLKPAVPKKPAQSVSYRDLQISRVAGMEDSPKKRSAGDQHNLRRLKVNQKPLDMASTARAYRNSDASSSAKAPDVYSREEIARLLRLADFSRERHAKHPHHSRRDYRREHLRSTLMGMWQAAGEVVGREIILFASVEGYSTESGRCVRQTRYNLRALEETGIIEMVFPANQRIRPGYFRHTATYRLRLDRLAERQRATHRQLQNRRPVAQALPPRPSHVEPQKPSVEPPQAESLPVVPSSHRSARRTPRQLTPREGRELVKEMVERMRGRTSIVEKYSGLEVQLPPNDARYRAPMSQQSALTTACQVLGIPFESAENHLKLCKWKPPDSDDS